MKDLTLADRMKTYYEGRSETYLTRYTPVIIRLDGCHFHTFAKKFDKPFDTVFAKTMQDTTKYLCEKIQGVKFAYTESDEISLLLIDYDRNDLAKQTEAWFDYRVQKIVSVAASLATAAFNKFFALNIPEDISESENQKLFNAYKKAIDECATFDARAFNLPKDEVVNYFIWRQQDAERNSVNMYGRQFMSQNEMHAKNSKEIRRLLEEKYHSPWENNPTFFKRGVCIQKVQYEEFFKAPNGNTGTVRRTRWDVNLEIPVFTQDKEFVSNYLKIEEQN